MQFDLGAMILYIIFGSVMAFLVYLLFDVKSLYANVRTHKYEKGHPRHEELKTARGVVEIEGEDLVFRDPTLGRNHFSIPVNSIRRVSKEDLDGAEGKVFRNITGALDERDYLYIEYEDGGEWHKLRLSAHKASSANNEVFEGIITARERLGF